MRHLKGRKVALASAITLLLLMPVVLWTAWPDILIFLDFESLGRNEQGYAEYRHRQTGIVFVSLPAGTFMMGSPEGEEGRYEFEGPVHEVTQDQWEEVMGVGNNPSRPHGAELPVDLVSWDDLHTVGGFLELTGFLLPSEAQWEYACRAGTTGPFSGTGKLDDMGWYRDNSRQQTHPVGQKQPNQYGL